MDIKQDMRLRLVFAAMNDLPTGAFICDSDGVVQFINKAYASYLGMSRDEAIGKHILELIPTSGIPRVLRNGKAELRQIRRFPNGANLLVNRVPLFAEDGKLIGALSMTLFDTSEQVRELLQSVKELDQKIDYCKGSIKSLLTTPYTTDSLIGESPAIKEARDLICRYAASDSSVLIIGDTGCGKELAAGALHAASRRADGPFVSVNCAAIPRELFESEVFGYQAGAFSGARREGSVGKIEAASGGTLFLDEVGDLPLSAQAKFLRALEEKKVVPLGSSRPRPVNFRLVAATNRNLEGMIKQGTFRKDFYYRINTMKLVLPPLSARREDIPVLARYFLEHMDLGVRDISPEAMEVLANYGWPGNVRELRNAVAHAASLCRGGRIEVKDLPSDCARKSAREEQSPILKNITMEAEEDAIAKAINSCGGNKTKAAAALGISRAALYVKLKKSRRNGRGD